MEGDNKDERSSGNQPAVITMTLPCSQFSTTCVKDMLKVVETFSMDYQIPHEIYCKFLTTFY